MVEETGKKKTDIGQAIIQYLNKDGYYHRDFGPAQVWEDGDRYYYNHDEVHREFGPAIIHPDGRVEYWKAS